MSFAPRWFRLAALLFLVGIVRSPLRAMAETNPMLVASVSAVEPSTTTVLGRCDAVPPEAERPSPLGPRVRSRSHVLRRFLNATGEGRLTFEATSGTSPVAGYDAGLEFGGTEVAPAFSLSFEYRGRSRRSGASRAIPPRREYAPNHRGAAHIQPRAVTEPPPSLLRNERRRYLPRLPDPADLEQS